MKQAPGDHLHQTDREAEVDSAAADELHRRPTHALHQLVELGLVFYQRCDGQILQVDEPRQVGLHFRQQVVDDVGRGSVHARQHGVAPGERDRVPQTGPHLLGQVASHFVDGSGERLAEILDRLPGVDLVQNLLGSQQLVGEHLDGHRRGLTGAARNHALPSKRPDADKLNRPVKHLQGNEFRCVADERGHQRHR